MSVLAVHLNPEHGFSKTPQPSIKLLNGLGVEGDCHLGKTTQHLWRLKSHASEPNLRQVHLIQYELFDEPDFHGNDGVRIEPGQMGENVTTTGIDLLGLSEGTKLHFVNRKYTQADFDSRIPRLFYEDSLLLFKYLVSSVLLGVVAMIMGYSVSWPHIAFAIACLNIVLPGYWCYTRDYFGEHAVITVTGLRHPCKKVENFRPGLQDKCVIRGGEKNTILKRKAGVMAVVTRAGTVEPGMAVIVDKTLRFRELPVLR